MKPADKSQRNLHLKKRKSNDVTVIVWSLIRTRRPINTVMITVEPYRFVETRENLRYLSTVFFKAVYMHLCVLILALKSQHVFAEGLLDK